jgi:hypothetical protein
MGTPLASPVSLFSTARGVVVTAAYRKGARSAEIWAAPIGSPAR